MAYEYAQSYSLLLMNYVKRHQNPQVFCREAEYKSEPCGTPLEL